MDFRHAVGAVRADNRQIGHAHFFIRPGLDQAHPPRQRLVARIAAPHLGEETPVDFVNDIQVPRQHLQEIPHRPAFQRLRQQRVVRVGQRPLRQVPRHIPAKLRLVEQDAHQLRHRQRRVRVVQLNRRLVGQRAPIRIVAPEPAHQVGQRARHQEILLRKPQRLAHFRGIVGIQNPRQRLRGNAAHHGAHEIARAEFLKVEIIRRHGAP